jgi:hypothetical protein
MVTLAPPLLVQASRTWETRYESAVFSGIVGDADHAARGGYHISIEDQSPNNYSVIRPDDKAPPGDWPRNLSSGLDMSMSRADMITCTRRWMAVWSDRTDPRRRYFNAFNGFTGSGGAKRWDFVANTVTAATSDHEWHWHGEVRRRYVNDPQAYRAMDSINRGETKEEYMTSAGFDATDDSRLWTASDRIGHGLVRGKSPIETPWRTDNGGIDPATGKPWTEKVWIVDEIKAMRAEQERQAATLQEILEAIKAGGGGGVTEAQVDARIAASRITPPTNP